jgi:hypothetical protein
MGIFSSIKDKLWGKKDEAVETANAEAAPPITETSKPATADVSASASTSAAPTASTSASSAHVDVAAILDAAVKANGQKLDWKRSIVDLMKALDLDSSLAARKELADELKYTGDKNDSATMNVWLHKALMKALAENGGKVPAELLD